MDGYEYPPFPRAQGQQDVISITAAFFFFFSFFFS